MTYRKYHSAGSHQFPRTHHMTVVFTSNGSKKKNRYPQQPLTRDCLPRVLQSPLLLSDSCLHLFLQSQLSVAKIEACAAGRTNFSVAQAVQRSGLRRFHSEEDIQKDTSTSCDSDSDRYCNSVLYPNLLGKSRSGLKKIHYFKNPVS